VQLIACETITGLMYFKLEDPAKLTARHRGAAIKKQGERQTYQAWVDQGWRSRLGSGRGDDLG
jgi:hypothetical protein